MPLTFRDDNLFAELTKDGWAVKCGWPGCNTKMALVLEERRSNPPRFAWFSKRSGGLHQQAPRAPDVDGLPSDQTQRHVWFPAAWSPDSDGVWHIGKHALARLKAGRTALNRNIWDHFRGQVPGWKPWNLPIRAICPHCGHQQWFDPSRLKVVANIVDLSRVGDPRVKQQGGQMRNLSDKETERWKRHPLTYRVGPTPS